VLSPGVRVHRDTVIADSIIFHDTVIDTHATIERTIIDKSVTIASSAAIGQGMSTANKRFPKHLSSGITVIGKRARIMARMTVGKNCIIFPEASVTRDVPSGDTIT
jgi:glucose-1-phosphate adenylyltransferase